LLARRLSLPYTVGLRDAVSLVKQLRGGDLTAVWVPDPQRRCAN
jgi:hypothetical protein